MPDQKNERKVEWKLPNIHQAIVEKSVNGVSSSIVLWKKRNFKTAIKLVSGLGQPVNLLRNHGFLLSIAHWLGKDQKIPKDPV